MTAIVRRYLVPAAYELLPPAMRSDAATRLLVAIGWQESRFTHRRQVNGPARGFWQFELGGGVHGVLAHAATSEVVADVWKALGCPGTVTPYGCYTAIEHNDVLAVSLARLLLWTLPGSLPEDEAACWQAYLRAWRPGKAHPETWAEAWRVASAA